MGSFLAVASNYQQTDAIPGYEHDHQGPTTEQTGSVHEAISSMFLGEVGSLGFLFHESPVQTVGVAGATPLEEPATPGISIALANRMRSAAEVTNTRTYQPRPAQGPGEPIVSGGASGSWSFTDTLRNEAAKLQGLVNKTLGRGQ